MSASAIRLLSLFLYALSLVERTSFGVGDGLMVALALVGTRGEWRAIAVRFLGVNLMVGLLVLSLLVAGESAEKMIALALRVNLIALVALGLYVGRDGYEIARALHAWRAPSKVVSLLFFSLRFIEAFRHEIGAWRGRLRARGVNIGTNRPTYRGLGYLLGALLARSFEEAEALALTLRARGYQGAILLSGGARASWLEGALLIVAVAVGVERWG